MHSQDNPTNPPSMIDRVAAIVARRLDGESATPPPDDLIANADQWRVAFLDAIEGKAPEAADSALSWIRYLDTLIWNVRMGCVYGDLCPPGVPIDVAYRTLRGDA